MPKAKVKAKLSKGGSSSSSRVGFVITFDVFMDETKAGPTSGTYYRKVDGITNEVRHFITKELLNLIADIKMDRFIIQSTDMSTTTTTKGRTILR